MADTRIKIEPFPTHGCLHIHVQFSDPGPSGSRLNGNSAAGWVVCHAGKLVSPVFRKVRIAKAWAEEHYAIAGWSEMERHHYHHIYAKPSKES